MIWNGHWLESFSLKYEGTKCVQCSLFPQISWREPRPNQRGNAYIVTQALRRSAFNPGHWVQIDFRPIAEKHNGTTSVIWGRPIMEDDGYPSVSNPSNRQPFERRWSILLSIKRYFDQLLAVKRSSISGPNVPLNNACYCNISFIHIL